MGHGSLKCLGLLDTDISKSVLLRGPWKQIVVSDLSMSPELECRGGCVRQSGVSQKFAPGTSFWEHKSVTSPHPVGIKRKKAILSFLHVIKIEYKNFKM